MMSPVDAVLYASLTTMLNVIDHTINITALGIVVFIVARTCWKFAGSALNVPPKDK